MKLSGHKVLITGGNGGIGLQLAREFVDRGNQVVICGRDIQKLDQAKALLGDVKTIQTDLAVASQSLVLAREAAEELGGLSILVNNAGIQGNFSFSQVDPMDIAGDIAEEIQINLTSLITLTAACLPMLKANESAAVINISSGLAITPKASAPVYCSTKAAVHSFSQALRYQMEDTLPMVKVFEVIPPLVDTQMTHGRGDGKISPRQVAVETFRGLEGNKYEILVGKAKILRILYRLAPKMAAKILRNS